MCNHVKHVCMCLLVSSLLFLIHPFTIDKLLTPTNLHIRYQCSIRYSINIVMTILGHHPRRPTCLQGLKPRGRTNPIHPHRSVFLEGFRAFQPRTHGPTKTICQIIMPVASHKHFPPINSLNIICDNFISFLQCNHTMNHFDNTTMNLHTNIRSNIIVTFQCNDTLKHFMKSQK